MHHSSFSAASSSSGQPDKPATAPTSTSHSSAEQPATPSHLKISSIHDVQRWMAEEPIASYSSADAQRLREAVAVLSNPKPRQEDVRPLQSKWQVAQQIHKKTRPLGDVIQEFKTKVIEAAKKLQLDLSDSAAQPVLSAVEQFAPMDTTASVELDAEPAVSELGARQRSRVNCCPHFDMVRVVFRIGFGDEIARASM